MISSSCTPFPAAAPSPCMASLASQLPGYPPQSHQGTLWRSQAPQLPNIRRMEAPGKARRKLQGLGQALEPGKHLQLPAHWGVLLTPWATWPGPPGPAPPPPALGSGLVNCGSCTWARAPRWPMAWPRTPRGPRPRSLIG